MRAVHNLRAALSRKAARAINTLELLARQVVYFPVSPLATVFWARRLLGIGGAPGPVPSAGIERILVVRTDEIGDLLMTSPFLRELRRNFPAARITLVVKRETLNLVERCPYVDAVHAVDVGGNPVAAPFLRVWRALRLARDHLRKERFDLAIVPRWDCDVYQSAFIAYFSNATHRVAYSENVTRAKRLLNMGYDRLFTHVVNLTSPRHEVEKNLDLMRSLGFKVGSDMTEAWVDGQDEAWVESELGRQGFLDGNMVVAVGIGASADSKQWPAARFAAVANHLGAAYGARFLVIGGPGDAGLAEEFAASVQHPQYSLCGKASLRKTIAALRHCTLYLGNDTGPKHMAAAVGVPVVEVNKSAAGISDMHLHSPFRFRAWGVQQEIVTPDAPLAPCLDHCISRQAHCILAVDADMVIRRIEGNAEALLGRKGGATMPEAPGRTASGRPDPAGQDVPPPLVSVVITTRNEEKNIENCLRSVQAQRYPSLETVVVDNGSTDRTKEIARRYTDLVFDKGPERSSQRNFGILGVARGKYALFLDADMVITPGLVSACVACMEKDGAVALHIPEIVLGRNFWSRVRRFERRFYDGTCIDGARFFERETFARTGGFDESMSGPEDWDLDKKLKCIGRISLLDEPRAVMADWPLADFVRERGVDPRAFGEVVYHNESEFDMRRYLSKKGYYSRSMEAYIGKWGREDADIRRQLGAGYRFAGVFVENGKWRRLLAHPVLSGGMYMLRFLTGLTYLRARLAR